MARGYQYETSPRKYDIDYEVRPRKNNIKAKKAQKPKKSKKQEKLENAKFKFLLTLNAIIFLSAMFLLGSRTALINQTFAEVQNLRSQISEIQKENEQLELSIQNSLNLSNIEQTAKDMLGMQKLSSNQTVYLNLPKKDYVEPSTEEIIIEKQDSIIQNIFEFISNLF